MHSCLAVQSAGINQDICTLPPTAAVTPTVTASTERPISFATILTSSAVIS